MVKSLNIIKRDGGIAKFDKCKIENAILKAMKYGSGVYESDIAKKISVEIESGGVNQKLQAGGVARAKARRNICVQHVQETSREARVAGVR